MKPQVAALLRQVSSILGLKPREDWEDAAEEALRVVAGRHGCSESEVLTRVAAKQEILFEVASFLTIGETHFFRHPSHFEAVTEHLRAHLIGSTAQRRAQRADLCVWSAGCASGEEPYSIAISIVEGIGAWALPRVRILGTDASMRSIGRGRHAAYGSWSFRGAPPWLRSRYFEDEDITGTQRLDERIRAAVSLEPGNILARAESIASESVDIIIFRNVAIYLEREPLRALYRNFERALVPGGLLFTSPSDPRPREGRLEPIGDITGSVYRRPFGPPPASVSHERATDTATIYPRPKSSLRLPARPRPARPRPVEPTRPDRVSPPPADTAPSAGPEGLEELYRRCVDAADAGQNELAMRLVDELVGAGDGARALILRAQLLLSLARPVDAVADLRAALFLAPGDPMGRFWYAVALRQSGEHDRSKRQLQQLERQLVSAPQDDSLAFSQHEMLEAVRFMKEENS